MAGRSGKNSKNNDKSVSKEFFEALAIFEQERGIPAEYMIEKISSAITNAIKKNNNDNGDVSVFIEPENNRFEVYLNKTVVEEVTDPTHQLTIEQAREINPYAMLGDKIGVRQDPREVGRIAAGSAKQTLRQGIRDHEKNQIADEMRAHHQEIVTAVVDRIDDRNGALILKIGKIDVPLMRNEQIEGEVYHEGDLIKVYVVDIKGDERGTRATISRTHPGLVKRLFENEVPEISEGIIEIKGVSREAGSRTKLAVSSTDENVDPVGACIGIRRSRVNAIVEQLGGEKIDIIKYSDDPVEFISNALAPATVVSVDIDEENPRVCRVKVPDGQLSLAIGHKGQNARLAARLTGFKIDIRPESGYFGEDEDEPKAVDEAVEAVDEVVESADEAVVAADEAVESADEEAEVAADEEAEEAADEEAAPEESTDDK